MFRGSGTSPSSWNMVVGGCACSKQNPKQLVNASTLSTSSDQLTVATMLIPNRHLANHLSLVIWGSVSACNLAHRLGVVWDSQLPAHPLWLSSSLIVWGLHVCLLIIWLIVWDLSLPHLIAPGWLCTVHATSFFHFYFAGPLLLRLNHPTPPGQGGHPSRPTAFDIVPHLCWRMNAPSQIITFRRRARSAWVRLFFVGCI
jgi:hypothetical protein